VFNRTSDYHDSNLIGPLNELQAREVDLFLHQQTIDYGCDHPATSEKEKRARVGLRSFVVLMSFLVSFINESHNCAQCHGDAGSDGCHNNDGKQLTKQ
jgi:hypothetical protein